MQELLLAVARGLVEDKDAVKVMVPVVPSLRRKTSLRRVLRFFVNSASRHLS